MFQSIIKKQTPLLRIIGNKKVSNSCNTVTKRFFLFGSKTEVAEQKISELSKLFQTNEELSKTVIELKEILQKSNLNVENLSMIDLFKIQSNPEFISKVATIDKIVKDSGISMTTAEQIALFRHMNKKLSDIKK